MVENLAFYKWDILRLFSDTGVPKIDQYQIKDLIELIILTKSTLFLCTFINIPHVCFVFGWRYYSIASVLFFVLDSCAILKRLQ